MTAISLLRGQTETERLTGTQTPVAVYSARSHPNAFWVWEARKSRFRAIVERPCFYCGKESGDGHFNGLDRTDSGLRVYSVGTVVSCCGTCNIMKYRWSVQEFLDHCVRVAAFAAALSDAAGAGPPPDAAASSGQVLPRECHGVWKPSRAWHTTQDRGGSESSEHRSGIFASCRGQVHPAVDAAAEATRAEEPVDAPRLPTEVDGVVNLSPTQ